MPGRSPWRGSCRRSRTRGSGRAGGPPRRRAPRPRPGSREAGLAANPPARLAPELAYRLGHAREQLADAGGALRAYVQASLLGALGDPFRLSAVARCAALYEAKRQYGRAIESYKDLVRNAKDKELAAAATQRVSQLEATRGKMSTKD